MLPILSALLGTISTRLRQQQKFSVCKMASYEIVSEIYKFRSRSMEYEGLALAQALRAKETAGDDKKKGDDEVVPPIPAKEKDRLARKMFVERVQMIYTKCMEAEMSKGTSVSHKTGGMDPQLLLLEDLEEEREQEIKKTLQIHVATRLYFITVIEWALGAEYVKAKANVNAAKRRARARESAKRAGGKLVEALFTMVLLLLLLLVKAAQAVAGFVKRKCSKRSSRDKDNENRLNRKAGRKVEDDETEAEAAPNTKTATQELLAGSASMGAVRKWRQKTFGSKVSPVDLFTGGGGVEEGLPEGDGAVVEVVTARGERLDETYIDEDEPTGGGDDAAGGEPASGGVSEKVAMRDLDNLFGGMTIDEYMKYRARPILTYFERTAPWRAFEEQCLEVRACIRTSPRAFTPAMLMPMLSCSPPHAHVLLLMSMATLRRFARAQVLIFSINSSGAVLVGVADGEYIPYVALTVAIAQVASSFLEFSRLSKQVEQYNAAQRDLHNLINEWDGMTRTERRRRDTIKKVVGTVENAMLMVAQALTDAIRSDQAGESGGEEGDGDGDDKK